MQNIASGRMCIQKYISTCAIPCNNVFVDIYVRQRRSLPARRSAWEWCATAPKRDMASSLPARARNINFEAPCSPSCCSNPANQRRTAESRIFLLGHPQPYSRRCSTSSSAVLRRLEGFTLSLSATGATTCSGIDPTP